MKASFAFLDADLPDQALVCAAAAKASSLWATRQPTLGEGSLCQPCATSSGPQRKLAGQAGAPCSGQALPDARRLVPLHAIAALSRPVGRRPAGPGDEHNRLIVLWRAEVLKQVNL